ncbi:MAG: hypothetical protein OXT09_19810 [Myxococcales bacterium]|nr:hypothetical protein [Myxococcales bacterium]
MEVFEGDVGVPIRKHTARYDAILLDVDNGPEGLTRASNDALYAAAGLRRAAGALRAAGSLWPWSAGPRAGYSTKLRRAGFTVEEHIIRADRRKRGGRHTLWEARLPAGRLGAP